MSTIKEAPVIEEASSFKMLQAMVGIGILCALLIVVTYETTKPRIAQLKQAALEKAIFKVIPGISKTAAFHFVEGTFVPVGNQKKVDQVVYAGYNDSNELVGVAINGKGQGYADIISVLYGYSFDKQQIIGFYVLESKETPGLGDKIEKDPDFLANFTAMDASLSADLSSIKNKITTTKSGEKTNAWEVDGITGATISSRAIGDILASSTEAMLPLIYKNKNAFVLPKNQEKDGTTN
ncbi:FMN-binding protein [Flammeovirga kamogawensis]|uniref:Ion-translocating oxidoreductase complex subunit G n=1 Tax=Flammeovirga kamogawensis TaxID=373891 RepID=A0ABX8H203_9BACT|nr:FMN-binding protein [Flammeovirga kamogawensis]MBB6462602.1 electron transport complex protein RnfG [Flammeovirga kamogawensis]QWG09653.1 FMN-binding protein [Flammeovirga kamogawensis]TRX65167.1 FMN-binding protein [Flammeovirga kamogawensis]